MYKVQKKDGRLEDFDRTKIVSGVVKAGCSLEEAEKIATEIEAWLPSAAVDGVIKSDNLRTKGLEVMKVVNPVCAAAYEVYQKPVETIPEEKPVEPTPEETPAV